MRLLPKLEECSPAAIAEAMRFLCDEWLCDVASDYAGKCIIIACALTIIERALLPERPAFFITAGQRGGGKTTTIHMISKAVLGISACAAAWSNDEEERRKALFSYFSAGLPMLTWDNIARGSTISCPHIEKALTNEFYSDRVLGVSEYRLVLSSTVHLFTGNNIGPRGDMASRSLVVRLAVNRPDPENRNFKHPDPLACCSRLGGARRGSVSMLSGVSRVRWRNPPYRARQHRTIRKCGRGAPISRHLDRGCRGQRLAPLRGADRHPWRMRPLLGAACSATQGRAVSDSENPRWSVQARRSQRCVDGTRR
jgi:hypothetical protein